MWEKPKLGRFERVYLSVKHEAELWPVYYTLLILKLLRVGEPQAFDQETGHVLPELDCSWTVLGIVFAGELAGDWLSAALMARLSPAVRPDIPTSSVQPSSSSPVVTTLVFCLVGRVCLLGISGMGEFTPSGPSE